MSVAMRVGFNNLCNVWGINVSLTKKIISDAIFQSQSKKEMQVACANIPQKEGDIVLLRDNIKKVEYALIKEILHIKDTKGITRRQMARDCHISEGGLTNILQFKKPQDGEGIGRVTTARLDILLRIRKLMELPTTVILSDTGKYLDINVPENMEKIRSKVGQYLRDTDRTNKSLEKVAGIATNKVSAFVRDPDEHLSTLLTLHCYSVWIAPIYFPNQQY